MSKNSKPSKSSKNTPNAAETMSAAQKLKALRQSIADQVAALKEQAAAERAARRAARGSEQDRLTKTCEKLRSRIMKIDHAIARANQRRSSAAIRLEKAEAKLSALRIEESASQQS